MCKPDFGLRIDRVERGRKINIKVNGKSVLAYEGETVHAALAAAGIRVFGFSKTGRPRGIFCGMGTCYQCLVTIDNIPDQQACMTLVEDRMEIITKENPENRAKACGTIRENKKRGPG